MQVGGNEFPESLGDFDIELVDLLEGNAEGDKLGLKLYLLVGEYEENKEGSDVGFAVCRIGGCSPSQDWTPKRGDKKYPGYEPDFRLGLGLFCTIKSAKPSLFKSPIGESKKPVPETTSQERLLVLVETGVIVIEGPLKYRLSFPSTI